MYFNEWSQIDSVFFIILFDSVYIHITYFCLLSQLNRTKNHSNFTHSNSIHAPIFPLIFIHTSLKLPNYYYCYCVWMQRVDNRLFLFPIFISIGFFTHCLLTHWFWCRYCLISPSVICYPRNSCCRRRSYVYRFDVSYRSYGYVYVRCRCRRLLRFSCFSTYRSICTYWLYWDILINSMRILLFSFRCCAYNSLNECRSFSLNVQCTQRAVVQISIALLLCPTMRPNSYRCSFVRILDTYD